MSVLDKRWQQLTIFLCSDRDEIIFSADAVEVLSIVAVVLVEYENETKSAPSPQDFQLIPLGAATATHFSLDWFC